MSSHHERERRIKELARAIRKQENFIETTQAEISACKREIERIRKDGGNLREKCSECGKVRKPNSENGLKLSAHDKHSQKLRKIHQVRVFG